MSDNTRKTSNAGDEKSSPSESLRDYRERMFGEDGRCEFDDQGKCVRGKRFYRRRAKAALNRAHDIRKFEIELLWKRTAYVATFQTLLFAALGFSFRAESGSIVSLFQLITCAAGVFSSFFWYLINKGSKFWHENWTHHIDFLEDGFEGKLHKTVLYDGDGSDHSRILNRKLYDAETQPYSVSRVNIWISILFCVAWSGLLWVFLLDLFKPFGAVAIPDFSGKEWLILSTAVLMYAAVLYATLFWCKSQLRSEFDDTYPEKDVRWARRELPNTIKMPPEKSDD